MPKHILTSNKMKKTAPLLNDPLLRQYVPELHWLSRENLKRMLFKHSVVYVKPNDGSQGLGIRRLKLLNDSRCEITDLHRSRRMSLKNAIKTLYKELDPKVSYIVQQGIDLATYNRRPFHIRVVLLKPVDSWQLTMMTGIMARQKNAVVTNESRGGVQKSIEDILYNYDQKRNPSQTFRDLIDLSHQIAYRIGSQLPLLLQGLDIAIDKRGKIWFIEANTLPDMSGMRELNDRISFHKYMKGKNRIGISTLLYSLKHR